MEKYLSKGVFENINDLYHTSSLEVYRNSLKFKAKFNYLKHLHLITE
jgi:hypothetical protein